MGLDAVVYCRCFQDKLVPIPDDLLPHIEMTHEGPDLKLPWEGHKELHNRFHSWVDSGCQHENMWYCSERISNWAGYRNFQQALGQAGWQHFPTLKLHLPQNNGGVLPADSAGAALEELSFFREVDSLGERSVLVDAMEDEIVQVGVAVYEGVFMRLGGTGIQYGLNSESGFFVRQKEDDGVLFSSRDFEQLVSGDTAKFRCRTSGKQYQAEAPIRNTKREAPLAFVVRQEKVKSQQFRYITEALEKLLKASMETGNPISWC